MSFENFKELLNILSNQPISEINFSGGEPFLNAQIVDMIEYACTKMSCDVTCATNMSQITDEQIERLSHTRVKLNIQFPYADEERFATSTGTGNINRVLDSIYRAKSKGVEIGLNSVIQSPDIDATRRTILFAIEHELPLKLLPQIGLDGSDSFKDFVYPILEQYNGTWINKGTGAIRWNVSYNSHKTTVLYIDSPCFQKDIHRCKQYGELRILPDFRVQTCILQRASEKLNLGDSKSVIYKLQDLWKNFNHC
jgi:cyclic pyranopterin phosphate synthase